MGHQEFMFKLYSFFLICGYICTFTDLSTEKFSLFSKVIQLVKKFLIVPITNAVWETNFSTLIWFKTSTLSTMADTRLNHLLMMLIYSDELDGIGIKLITIVY